MWVSIGVKEFSVFLVYNLLPHTSSVVWTKTSFRCSCFTEWKCNV